MTDEEIVKALECCKQAKIVYDCMRLGCPCFDKWVGCVLDKGDIYEYALALINRQKAEIERLVKRIETISNNPAIAVTFNKDQKEEIAGYIELQVKKIKAEAIKEFAEALKEYRRNTKFPWQDFSVNFEIIDSLAEEMIEEMAGDPHE